MTLPNLPAAQEEAERMAKEAWAHLYEGDFVAREWDAMDENDRGYILDLYSMNLRDLRRPASMDFWRRWLGQREGLDVSGGVVMTRVAPLGKVHGDWLLEDCDGNQRVVLANAKERDPALALASALLSLTPTTPENA